MKKMALVCMLGLSACGGYSFNKPLAVDGSRNANFAQDETECRALAANFNPGKQAGSIGAGAVSGALIGNLTSSAGHATEGGFTGAAIGGVLGAAEGYYEDEEARRQVLVNCMLGRGHKVIG
ncbi:glycine zipper domain-containing protein [Ruegeria sp. Ofav3-42]|uniref:glycine zipper domain-containing protein n=1 Tax=Ruegeria sp. Ofav3-42 TaxID=2917759 RepID=UPI001EF6FDE8|nr:glycine zipper domain-containing protein [Ruegeria sp. Ofav3-42]MCG7521834.1 glycine zipper domain-containing protein [Ruegeria sp. Ofav3-42]